jgi:hypothetical protein
MYTISKNIKLLSFVLMAVGILSLGYGFMTTPSSVEEVKSQMEQTHAHSDDANSEEAHDTHAVNSHHDEAHAEHVYHQQKNRPWSAMYTGALFFFFIALGTLFFLGVQYIAQAGWSVVLLRVMEGIASYLLVGGVIVIAIIAAGGAHLHHIFHWMDASLVDPNSPNYDYIIAGKAGYLNVPFFLIRAVIYLAGWYIALRLIKKYSLEQETAADHTPYKKIFKVGAIFTVFFAVTSSMVAWDWVMSIDPHWFSTLFGWYVFAGMFVSAVSMIQLVTIYLRSRGFLPFVNPSHIHDLGKFMFGLSVFWTYLWFSQFLLIWYSNIPEEVTYYMARFEDYKIPFFVMVAMNFAFPLLVLMDSAKKKVANYVIVAGVVIILGHYLDLFVMIMPGSVGSQWSIGIVEIGSFLGFLGLFIYIAFTALSKRGLLAKGHPMLKESEHYHYYNIEH